MFTEWSIVHWPCIGRHRLIDRPWISFLHGREGCRLLQLATVNEQSRNESLKFYLKPQATVFQGAFSRGSADHFFLPLEAPGIL